MRIEIVNIQYIDDADPKCCQAAGSAHLGHARPISHPRKLTSATNELPLRIVGDIHSTLSTQKPYNEEAPTTLTSNHPQI